MSEVALLVIDWCICWWVFTFLSDPGVWGPIYVSWCLSVCPSVSKRRFADLTDVTLADEDTDSILTDIANILQ